MLDHLKNLLQYQEWADAQFFWRWGQFDQALENEDIKKLANHLVMVQRLFLNAMEQMDAPLPQKGSPLLSIGDLKETCRSTHGRLLSFVNNAPEEDLSRTVSVPWFPAGAGFTVSDAIVQVLFHTQHHRAQLLQSVSRYAEKPMIVDYISWIFKGKPPARWD